MDEPLSNLDAKLRVQTRTQIASLQRRLGVTTVYVTHDQVEAMTLGDRIAVFNQGRVEQLGVPLSLYHRPANVFVAGFIGAPRINLIPRPAAGAAAAHRALWDRLAGANAMGAMRIGLRPEHLQLVPAEEGVAAQVVLAEHLGDASIIHLRVDGVDELLHARLGAERSAVEAGQRVGLWPDAHSALAFGADGRLMQ
jgi:multiple sugar transport system ATP-binding protein